jgi:hypothetical protein
MKTIFASIVIGSLTLFGALPAAAVRPISFEQSRVKPPRDTSSFWDYGPFVHFGSSPTEH